MHTEVGWKKLQYMKTKWLIFAFNPNYNEREKTQSKTKQDLRNNMKGLLVTITVTVNIYWILGMCQIVFQVLYRCSLHNNLLRWVLLSSCPFHRFKKRSEKLINLPKVTLPISSEAGVKPKGSDIRANTFNLCAMLPPQPEQSCHGESMVFNAFCFVLNNLRSLSWV